MTELENHMMTKDPFFIVLGSDKGLALFKGEGTKVYCIIDGKKYTQTRIEALEFSQKLLSKGYSVHSIKTTSEETLNAYLEDQLK